MPRFLYLIILSCAVTLSACGRSNADRSADGIPSPVITTDLSNRKIHAIAEDAQGHIWIGTFRGLNKYDGHGYRQYFCNDDSLSLPDNQIQDILCDSRGRLWVSTVNGVCRYTDRDNFHQVPIHASNRNAVQLLEDREGHIFINCVTQLYAYDETCDCFSCPLPDFDPQRTFNGRCYINSLNELWDVKPNCLRCYDSSTLQLKDSIALHDRFFLSSCIDKEERIWMGGEGGMECFDTRTRHFIPLSQALLRHPLLSHTAIDLIHPYADGLLLSSNEHGLFYYNAAEQTVIHQDESGFPFEAPGFYIQKFFTDSHGNLWMGSIDQGYTVRYRYKERFNGSNYLSRQFENKSVLSLATDREQRLWISTLMDGFYVYDIRNQHVEHINIQHMNGTGFNWVFTDRNDKLWITTNGNRISRCRYHGNGQLEVEQSYQVFMPMSITQTDDGTVWVSTASQYILYLRPDAQEFRPLQVYTQGFTFIPTLLPLDTGQLLVSGFNQKMMQVDIETLEIQEVAVSDEDYNNCIRRSVLIPTILYRTHSGDIYIGTVSNGLLRYTPSTARFQPVEGISCNDISSIEEDATGHLWVSTQYGLNCYDPTQGRFTYYDAADGIGGNQFYDRASCRLPDGTLVFGGTHGLTFFHPDDTEGNRTFPLLFENLKIHNRLVMPQEGGCIDRHLSHRPDIRLRYDENNISLSFAALDYSEYPRINYQYKLEGFDRDWIEAGHNHEAYYGNLPAGHYTFRVRATRNDRSDTATESTLRMTVSPAPWFSIPALLFYTIAAAALICIVIRGWRRILKEKEAARQARIAKEQEQRVNKMNMSFFANMSHEFRTPLTMITGPVAQLERITKGESAQLLAIVRHSVERMLRLVNQLMDFNKLENDTLRLQVRRNNIIDTLRRAVAIFRINAEEKGITLATYGLEESCLFYYDNDKVEGIVTNLLSNAMKFTPQGGQIDLRFDLITREGGHHMLVEVIDTGPGIPEDQLENIFKRYYQLDNQNKGSCNWGTGIGLYYARALARLHHGDLWAANRKEGTGSVFSLTIPVDDSAYSEDERKQVEEKQTKAFPLKVDSDYGNYGNRSNNNDNPTTLLIVDDDAEVVHYLKTLLSPYYRILCCFSADSAFEMMNKHIPDLIISDVVMPGKDGYALCRQIKGDLQLCHIPVILVTAKTTMENQIEGLNTGADAYVSKPFEPEYLLAFVRSLLENRKKVKSLLSSSTHTETIAEAALTPQDNAFMTELYALMESELGNAELDVARMIEILHISRTKFYYKVKGLTGENPASFFKTYKLNRAAELLQEGTYNVSEIADMTGFNTLSHFSTSFKKQFGVVPSEYQSKQP